MDSSGIDANTVARLSDKDKQELQRFLINESQKARISSEVHKMTDVCWKKCFGSSSMTKGSLTSPEESCTKNCVNRFLDGNETIIRELERYRNEAGLN